MKTGRMNVQKFKLLFILYLKRKNFAGMKELRARREKHNLSKHEMKMNVHIFIIGICILNIIIVINLTIWLLHVQILYLKGTNFKLTEDKHILGQNLIPNHFNTRQFLQSTGLFPSLWTFFENTITPSFRYEIIWIFGMLLIDVLSVNVTL